MKPTAIWTASRIAAGIIKHKVHLLVALMVLLLPVGVLLKVQAENSRRLDSPLKATTGSGVTGPTESKATLPKAIIGYTQSLRQLAQQAQDIVGRLPHKPEEVSQGFQDLEKVLTQSRDLLIEILNRKEAIRAEKDRMLQSAALVQQAFGDKAFQIDNEIDQLRRSSTNQPKATEASSRG